MLVRCIVLSLDRFESQTEDVKGKPQCRVCFKVSNKEVGFLCEILVMLCVSFPVVEVLSECCLLSYMARVENRLSFLFRLINIINVQTLTQVLFHSHLVTWNHWTLMRSLNQFQLPYCSFHLLEVCWCCKEKLSILFYLVFLDMFSAGECELFKYQFGDLDVGQTKG